MAFNDLTPASGPFYLAPGAWIAVVVWFGNREDRGAQWIMAHPLRGEAPTMLEATNHAKILDYSIGTVVQNGPPTYHYNPDDAQYSYQAVITNKGNVGVRFSVQGGGNA